MSAKTKKYIVIGVIAILVFFAGKFAIRYFDLNNASKYYAPALASSEKVRADSDKIADRKIKEANAEKAVQDKKIKDLLAANGVLVNTDYQVQGKLAELQKQYATLTDCPSQVTNLTGQINLLQTDIANVRAQLLNANEQTAAMTSKYWAQVKITDASQVKYDALDKSFNLSTLDIKALQGDLRRAHLWGIAKDAIIIGAVAYAVYGLVKK
jgi:hypothetical protein